MMNKQLGLALMAVFMALTSLSVEARDDSMSFSLQPFFERADVKERLGNDVKFYFGDSKHGAVATRLGQYQANKKTNAFNKTDQEACEWALFSALLKFRDRAQQLGGNAVINISGNYKRVPFSSVTEFQCGAGNLMAGVTIVGDVVKLK